MPFDLVVVEEAGVRSEYSVEEYLAMPLSWRAKRVLARAVSFYRGDEPIDRGVALQSLRAASVARNG